MPVLNRILILILLMLLIGCAKRASILEISDEDLQYINEIIKRPGEEVRFFPSYDNVPLASTLIQPEMPTKGVILFIHGLGTRSNVYLPLADELAANGYIIYLLDIRGHGYSHGVKGHMPSSDAMSKDIYHFYEYVFSVEGNSQKYIAMGHRLGTYIWINMLSSYRDIEIDALVLISGGTVNNLNTLKTIKENSRYFSHINNLKAFFSIFNHNVKPIHIVFPDIPQLEKSGFVQDYGLSFFSMFRDSEDRFKTFFQNSNIPIMMISGSQDELFAPEKIEESYNLIENKNKKLISLEGKTHTSIIWSAGSHINSWLEDYYQTR
jgi:pimeloyl-ACP methyl ester carboxylesterase